MSLPTFDQFRSQVLARGADEVIERAWTSNQVVEKHTHPFDADALVVQGEMWLDVEGQGERRLVAGDTFNLTRGTPHAERYGAEGAVYWVGRKN